MQDGDGHFLQDAPHNDRLSQSARPGGAQGQQDALVEGGRLVDCFLKRLVEREVQLLVLQDVVAQPREEDEGIEPGGTERAAVRPTFPSLAARGVPE